MSLPPKVLSFPLCSFALICSFSTRSCLLWRVEEEAPVVEFLRKGTLARNSDMQQSLLSSGSGPALILQGGSWLPLGSCQPIFRIISCAHLSSAVCQKLCSALFVPLCCCRPSVLGFTILTRMAIRCTLLMLALFNLPSLDFHVTLSPSVSAGYTGCRQKVFQDQGTLLLECAMEQHWRWLLVVFILNMYSFSPIVIF